MTTKKKILIADDDPRNRKLLETLLRAEGYEVRLAESGAAALKSIADDAPDLALLDLMMPGMDGFELAQRLKAETTSCSIPIIMVTALDDEGSRARLGAAGINEIITKPVDRWELTTRVKKLLDGISGGETP